jgi:hypothetical protein
LASAGCAGGTVENSAADDGEETTSSLSSGLIYFYVSPLEPGSIGGPLALRRANAVPSTLSPTYGAAVLPKITLAADALTTQKAVDAIIKIPYAGHENSVVAVFGGRDKTGVTCDPTFEVVELYTPSQPVAITGAAGVAQKDAFYQVAGAGANQVTVRLINEKDYKTEAVSALAEDFSGSANPAAAKVAVQGGAFFTGSADVPCTKFLFWTTCKAPTAVHVAAYFSAN